jgi:hypothetical protein
MSTIERGRLRMERVVDAQMATSGIELIPTAERGRHRTSQARGTPGPWPSHRLGPMLWLADFFACICVT